MSNDFELSIEDRPETNISDVEDFFPEFPIGAINQGAKESSSTPTSPRLLSADERERVKQSDDYIKRLGPTTLGTPFDESLFGLFVIGERVRSEIREIIRTEFRHIPETHWVQNLLHPSYHLHQPIAISVERADDTVTATYDDIELCGTGASVKEAKSNLCAKIVSRYQQLGESAPTSQEYTFLKRIIEEVEPAAWQELKQLYKEKLEEIPYVQKGFIRTEGNNAEVIIVLSEESAEKIMELAQLDLNINQGFRSLTFSVEYKATENNLELNEFECFYGTFA